MAAPEPSAGLPGPAAGSPRRGGGARRWGIALLVLLALMVLGAIALVQGLPALIRWQLPQQLSAVIGRPVTLGAADFRLADAQLTLEDLRVGGATPGAPSLLQIRRLQADLAVGASLRHLAPVLEALTIDAPQLQVARLPGGGTDLDDLITRLRERPASPDTGPPRFALYNLQVRNGSARLDDRVAGRTQRIDALTLGLPFLSGLPADVQVRVEPRLAFLLNGATFDSGAQALPFAQTRSGDLRLAFEHVDLAPYLVYLPATVPLRPVRGSLAADLAAHFAMPPGAAPTIELRGRVAARDVALEDRSGAPVGAWRELVAQMRRIDPAAHRIELASLKASGLQARVRRQADGRVVVIDESGAPVKPSPGKTGSGSGNGSTKSDGAAPAWQVVVDALELDDAALDWQDATVKPAAALALTELSLRAAPIAWPIQKAIAVQADARIVDRNATGSDAAAGRLHLEGPVTERTAALQARLEGQTLAALRPYLSPYLAATLDGTLGAQAQIDWAGAPEPHTRITLPSVTLQGLALHEHGAKRGSAAPLAWQQLELADTQVDVDRRSVSIGRVQWRQPALQVERAADGRLRLQSWLAAHPPSRSEPRGSAATDAPWRVSVREFALQDGRIDWRDESVRNRRGEAVDVQLLGLNADVKNVQWNGKQLAAPVQVTLRSQLASLEPSRSQRRESPGARGRERPEAERRERPRAQRRASDSEKQPAPHQRAAELRTAPRGARTASIDVRGSLSLAPLHWNGRARVERLPVAAFAPYAMPPTLHADLISAHANWDGSVELRERPAGMSVQARGQARLTDVQVASRVATAGRDSGAALRAAPGSEQAADELLSWQALSLKDLAVQSEPGARPRIDIGAATLDDFFARLMITPEGRFNLQDVTGDAAGPTPPGAASSASGSTAPSAAPAAAAAAPPASAASVAAASRPAGELPVALTIGSITLRHGRVDFNDRFIQPNYSADLTELNGTIGTLRSDSTEMAAIELRGRAAGTALLDIQGRVNPLLKPLAMDLRARATDLELAPLSPYAGKYAGYGIERGKLTMQIAYRIDPDGKLEASNQIILNQLTFGEKVDSPDATKLPVRLAVALLKDRHGVIDLNLPITGSVNDPQFSVGSLIWRLLGNLIVKVVTSPFALFGGGNDGADNGRVVFVPGTTRFAPGADATLDKIAQALQDRPQLKMTVAGSASPQLERAAYQQASVEARIHAEARREAVRSGRGRTASEDADPVTGAQAAAAGPAGSPASASASASGPASASASAIAGDAARSSVGGRRAASSSSASGSAVRTAAQSVASSEAAVSALSAAERTLLLERLYADMPGKPRNAIGLARQLPPAQMEALLIAQVPVDAAAMRELALQRGLKVRDALIARGLPSERLFLAAPKVHGPPASGSAARETSADSAAASASGSMSTSAAAGTAPGATAPSTTAPLQALPAPAASTASQAAPAAWVPSAELTLSVN